VVRKRTGISPKSNDKLRSDPPGGAPRGAIDPRRNTPTVPGPDLSLGPRGVSLIAVGASTGGPPCIRQVLANLHAKSPPALVVQHMPPEFMSGFVSWLGPLLPVPVVEAEHFQPLLPGRIYVAPGGRHLTLAPKQTLVITDGPAVSYQRPSVDVLFNSVAEHAEGVAAGVLLTGMGEDGAQGLLGMRRRGHVTVAQDEASSLIFGMPGSAIALGAAAHVASPTAIAEALGRLTFLLPSAAPTKVTSHD
jgi:two-component system chemotaxis response regulator CheB